MDQYQRLNAAHKINGYYTPPRCSDKSKVPQAFEAAKAECLFHLREALAHVETMDLALFLANRR